MKITDEMIEAAKREYERVAGTYVMERNIKRALEAALAVAPELDPYDDFCPTCDAPNPWHADTCAVPFRPHGPALDSAPEPVDHSELIAEADKAYEDVFNVAQRERDLIRRLADALEGKNNDS